MKTSKLGRLIIIIFILKFAICLTSHRNSPDSNSVCMCLWVTVEDEKKNEILLKWYCWNRFVIMNESLQFVRANYLRRKSLVWLVALYTDLWSMHGPERSPNSFLSLCFLDLELNLSMRFWVVKHLWSTLIQHVIITFLFVWIPQMHVSRIWAPVSLCE